MNMQINIVCPQCNPEFDEPPFITKLVPKNDCIHEITCPQGHQFKANILYHEFQLLFEVAINALVDNYYREAIGSFAASYERFMELFIKIVIESHDIKTEVFNKTWNKVSRQSERQLGAFIFIFIREFGESPNIISDKQVNLRNKVIHQGYFPTKLECLDYGNEVLHFIRETLKLLYNSEIFYKALVSSSNARGDFSSNNRPLVSCIPWVLIGTNRSPNNDSERIEDMLAKIIIERNKTQ